MNIYNICLNALKYKEKLFVQYLQTNISLIFCYTQFMNSIRFEIPGKRRYENLYE